MLKFIPVDSCVKIKANEEEDTTAGLHTIIIMLKNYVGRKQPKEDRKPFTKDLVHISTQILWRSFLLKQHFVEESQFCDLLIFS